MTSGTLLSKRLRLHRDVLLSRPLLRGSAEIYLIKDLRSGRAFEVTAREYFIMSRLDGRRSLAEIGEEYAHAFGRRLAEANWQQLLGLLYSRGLLDPGGPENAPDGSGRAAERIPRTRASPAVVEWSYRRSRWLLSRPVVLSLVGLTVAVQVVLAAHLDQALAGLRWFWDHPLWLVAVALLAWVSAALHELAHGVAARHFGCTVTAISVLTLRCRVDSYLYLRSTGAQLTIASAGGLANGVLLLPFAVAWLVLPPAAPARPALAGILLIGSAQALINFIPLPPLDGYKVLSHALGITNLATGSRQFLRLALRGLVGRPPGITTYPRRARLGYASYGLIILILSVAAGTATVLIGREVAADRLGSTTLVVAFVVVAMTLAGWLAGPGRRSAAPDSPEPPAPEHAVPEPATPTDRD